MQYTSRVVTHNLRGVIFCCCFYFWLTLWLWLACDGKACFVGNTAFRSLCISPPRVRFSDELGCMFSFLVRVVGERVLVMYFGGCSLGQVMICVLSKEDCYDHPCFNSYLFLGSDVRPGSCRSMKNNNTKGCVSHRSCLSPPPTIER